MAHYIAVVTVCIILPAATLTHNNHPTRRNTIIIPIECIDLGQVHYLLDVYLATNDFSYCHVANKLILSTMYTLNT